MEKFILGSFGSIYANPLAMVKPPSNNRLTPLTYLDSSPARYATASATSSAPSLTPFRLADLSIVASKASLSKSSHAIASGVATPCGDTQLTRIPCLPSSAAALLISPTTACFEHVYACGTNPAVVDAVLAVITMLPCLAGVITLAAYLVARNTPVTFTDINRWKSSTSQSGNDFCLGSATPALLNMTSSFPCRATATSTALATSDSLVTSQWT
ncbi:hypothetical protein ZIOFF_040286 [Zingiber officinale]|uniref:Uncharacterized protein n=1 Tax=Zingiber officinale TaxID=94328 RepID=A0A8J5L4A7_ZINOF|nr:hypothetical protein ZIOFF_040286 [Zingiber officinale]